MSQDAAQSLIDAVGSDLRTLAAAIRQLADDWAGERLTADMVNKYFAGRAEVTSFAVSDDVLFGRPGPALEKLRWALSSGVAPVLVTSALANNLRSLGKYVDVRSSRMPDYEIARSIGVPSWKVKTLARQAQGWNSPALAMALVEVSRADAAVKGAATDPGYALEQLVLTIDRQRRELTRRR